MPEAAQMIDPPKPLEPFEGSDVIGSSIQITKAGDGLSEALSVEPASFHLGEKRYVVLECIVAKIRYTEVKDTKALKREHTFEAQGATIVDATLVADLIAAQREVILRAKEDAAGIQRLPMDEDPGPDLTPLKALKMDQLKALADANAVAYVKSVKKDHLIELLSEVPGILDAARSFDDVADHPEAAVTSLDDRRSGDEWTD